MDEPAIDTLAIEAPAFEPETEPLSILEAEMFDEQAVPEPTIEPDFASHDEVEPVSLFDRESVVAAEIEPAIPRFTHGFNPVDHEPAADLPRARHDAGYDSRAAAVAVPPEAERWRPGMLALALMLVLALLIGFAAGHAVAGRDRAPDATAAAGSPGPAGATEPPAGKEFSEQAVTPQAPAPAGATADQAPRTGSSVREAGQVPPVPGDEPPEARTPAPAKPLATTGALTVRSTPSRAAVTVDGTWRGRTPLTLEAMKLGTYTVRVVQPGYEVERQSVTLSAGDPERTLSFRLQPSAPAAASPRPAAPTATSREAAPAPSTAFSGTVFVDSLPRGATILLDGKPVGTTPSTITDVAIGTHVFRLELADHHYWTTSRRVVAGEETRVTGSLERIR